MELHIGRVRCPELRQGRKERAGGTGRAAAHSPGRIRGGGVAEVGRRIPVAPPPPPVPACACAMIDVSAWGGLGGAGDFSAACQVRGRDGVQGVVSGRVGTL